MSAASGVDSKTKDADEALALARGEAIDEMLAELIAGRDVVYGSKFGSKFANRIGCIPLSLDASDVRDEIDGEVLRTVMIGQYNKGHTAMTVWFEAARRVCERHVDEYLAWRATR